MVADDTYYITPHEAALAAVATSMKKARLQIVTLIINGVLGGLLFSSGSILCVAIHSENPGIWENNPGIVNMLSGVAFGIGLFYVVIMGADLFNSNILFFSVGVLRRAVSIYDVIVSWIVSLLANIGGTLFVSYVLCDLSRVSKQELWVIGSRKLVEDKASFSFVETMLKGIAGNFLVCLAIYLQLMAKPIHVKFIVLILPIFTFVSCGFTHTVADMSLSYIGMLNGADVSVGKYIWKLLIPAVVGNIIGGFAFSLLVPFYLHLVVVERDRKRLSLPEYEARDEQPELNFDSRVVRVSPRQNEEEAAKDDLTDDTDDSGVYMEKPSVKELKGVIQNSNQDYNDVARSNRSLPVSYGNGDSHSVNSSETVDDVLSSPPESFMPESYNLSAAPSNLISRTATSKSYHSIRSARSANLRKRHVVRSPPGVFPVRGMGEPLEREKTIENPYSGSAQHSRHSLENIRSYGSQASLGVPLDRPFTTMSLHTHSKDEGRKVHRTYTDYDPIEDRPGAKLERAITKLVEHKPKEKSGELPRTTQEAFPFNDPKKNSQAYFDHHETAQRGNSQFFKRLSHQSSFARNSSEISDFNKDLEKAGISPRIAASSNNVAGMPNYSILDARKPSVSNESSSSVI